MSKRVELWRSGSTWAESFLDVKSNLLYLRNDASESLIILSAADLANILAAHLKPRA